jgi:hypothetical protein
MVGGVEIGVAKDHAEQSNQQMTSAVYQSLAFIILYPSTCSSLLFLSLFFTSSFIPGATTLYEFWPAQLLTSIYFYPVHTFSK